MNERIYELIRQSAVPADQAESYALAKGLIKPTEKLDVAKFAELIVRECGSYLNSPEFIGRSDLDWAMVLNEHFGVKE